jgi:response regulator RpfG family c-di-GMP phosphodiesterase
VSTAFLALAALSTVVLIVLVCYVMPRARDLRVLSSFRAFGSAVELRFPFYRGRTDDVVNLSGRLAEKIGLGSRDRRDLALAARLRDLGLVSTPYQTLNGRAWDDWTDAERQAYDRHAEVGADMLERIPSVAHLAPIVRLHHDRFDTPSPGVGPSSRVLAVVAGYVRALHREGQDAARHHLHRESGSAYDPDLVRELLHLVERNDFRPRR